MMPLLRSRIPEDHLSWCARTANTDAFVATEYPASSQLTMHMVLRALIRAELGV